MADIKKILNKKKWTGKELGILELTNMAVTFGQSVEGKEVKPIVEPAQLRRMIRALGDSHERNAYNAYISVHEWLSIQYNIANTQFQKAQHQTATLLSSVTEISMIEDAYEYREKLPCIMTQKQYDELKERRLGEYLTTDEGTDAYTDVFFLIDATISHALKRLEKEPDKPNYLKAIRTKYKKKPVEDKRIYEKWNDCTGVGYWALKDGRRRDEMTDEEWAEAVLAETDRWEQATIIFNSDTQEEIDRRLGELYSSKTEWHASPDAPTDLKKWDVIEEDNLWDFYVGDTEDGTALLEDFVAEFPELTEATMKEIDGVLGTKYSSLPVSKWKPIKNKTLYNKDFCGTKEWVESTRYVLEGNLRALLNGVAILTEDSLQFHNTVDEDGNYKEPVIDDYIVTPYALTSFFVESDYYASSVMIMSRTRETLLGCYYYLMGYNYAIERIAELLDVPDFVVFKEDLSTLEANMTAFRELVTVLYNQIRRADYKDKTLQTRKLHVLRDYFYPVDYESLQIPEENKEKADTMIQDFSAFSPEHADAFSQLIFERASSLGAKKDKEDSQ